jgi:hypothetical protein
VKGLDYSLQKPVRRRFQRKKVITDGIDDQWDADLMDMSKYASKNEEFAYILVVIDIFSKYTWLRPLKNKKGNAMSRAFGETLEEGKRPSRLRTDKGQYFQSREFNGLLTDRDIAHLSPTLNRKGFLAFLVLLAFFSDFTRFGQYIFHHRLVFFDFDAFAGAIPIVL